MKGHVILPVLNPSRDGEACGEAEKADTNDSMFGTCLSC